MRLYLLARDKHGAILFQECAEYPQGKASEQDLQHFARHHFAGMDLSDRCRNDIKSVSVYSLATTLKL
jgi:hypothetical protein